MQKEFHAFLDNGTWELVPFSSKSDSIGCKWVFKTKLKSDGLLDKYKVRLVAKGYNQVEGNNFSETFSPVIKP